MGSTLQLVMFCEELQRPHTIFSGESKWVPTRTNITPLLSHAQTPSHGLLLLLLHSMVWYGTMPACQVNQACFFNVAFLFSP